MRGNLQGGSSSPSSARRSLPGFRLTTSSSCGVADALRRRVRCGTTARGGEYSSTGICFACACCVLFSMCCSGFPTVRCLLRLEASSRARISHTRLPRTTTRRSLPGLSKRRGASAADGTSSSRCIPTTRSPASRQSSAAGATEASFLPSSSQAARATFAAFPT